MRNTDQHLDQSNPEELVQIDLNLNCPAAGVFGQLELYGLPHNVYHTKLGATANAGSNTVTLSQSVDWQVCVIKKNHTHSFCFTYCT